jgi:hypothetical protein
VNRTELATPLYWMYGPQWEWLHYVQHALWWFTGDWPPRWAVFLLVLAAAVGVLQLVAALVETQLQRVNRQLMSYALAPALALWVLLRLARQVIERWGMGPYEISLVRRPPDGPAEPVQEGQEAA